MTKLFNRLFIASLKIFYTIKVSLFRIVVGHYAPADVLSRSLRPDIVLALYGAKIGNNVRILPSIVLAMSRDMRDFSNLIIGDDVYIGRNVFIDLAGEVKIGNRVTIGMFSRIYCHQNVGNSKLNELYPSVKGDIIIPDDTVIGTSVIILYPFSFTKGTFIAAGSVVSGNYNKPYVLAGNPARPVPFRYGKKASEE